MKDPFRFAIPAQTPYGFPNVPARYRQVGDKIVDGGKNAFTLHFFNSLLDRPSHAVDGVWLTNGLGHYLGVVPVDSPLYVEALDVIPCPKGSKPPEGSLCYFGETREPLLYLGVKDVHAIEYDEVTSLLSIWNTDSEMLYRDLSGRLSLCSYRILSYRGHHVETPERPENGSWTCTPPGVEPRNARIVAEACDDDQGHRFALVGSRGRLYLRTSIGVRGLVDVTTKSESMVLGQAIHVEPRLADTYRPDARDRYFKLMCKQLG